MILTSPYPSVKTSTLPLHEKILSAALRHIERDQEKLAFISAEDPNVKITFKELYVQALAVGTFLSKRNFGHNDVCCLVLPNCIEFAVFYVGSLQCGGAISGASAMFTYYELGKQFVDSQCKVVLTDESHIDKVFKASKDCPKIETIICIRSSNAILPNGVYSWEDVIKTPVSNIPKYNYSPDDLALLPYSSGTTGSPKGVILSHKNFGTMVDVIIDHFDKNVVHKLQEDEWDYFTENLLLVLPFYHIYGFGLMNQSLVKGTTGIIFSKFEPTFFLKAIEKYKVKILFLVPPILLFLTKHSSTADYDLSSVRFVLTGAAPAGKDLCEEFLRKHKNVRYLAQAYGMTECGMASHLPCLDRKDNFNNVGIVASTFQQKIICVKTGNVLPVGEPGEICVRGPTIMRGYLNKPEATMETIDREGWLHTGDIGYIDSKGQTIIVDRLKELIKVKGLQVPPAELEDLLLSHPLIHDAAVIGIPDKATGEKPKAFVVRADESLTEETVQKYVESKVSPYKFLTGGVTFVSTIPKSPSGKILRRLLKDEVAKEQKAKL